MALGLSIWGIFGLLITIIGTPLHLILPRHIGIKLGRNLIHRLFGMFVVYLRLSDLVKADLTALDGLKNIKHSFIAAPNHTSLWDVVFIIARLPQAICMMKRSILQNPILGVAARLAGYIANDGNTRSFRHASAALADGGQLLLFPEGTRTHPDAQWTNPLKGGCALIAILAQVPVYPIFIRSDTRFLEKGWPLWRRPVFPITLTIELGPPILPAIGETAHEFTLRLSQIYQHELARPHPLRRECRSKTAV